MMRTQRIRRISPASRRPYSGRPLADPQRRTRREAAPQQEARHARALVRAQPRTTPVRAPRPRSRRLRLVVVNARPRRRRTASPKPVFQLVRGRAPALALPRRVVPAAPPQRQEPSRVAQLVFVVAMAAVGLAALATSVGQILARSM